MLYPYREDDLEMVTLRESMMLVLKESESGITLAK